MFWSKVTKTRGCWIWEGGRCGKGNYQYGRYSYRLDGKVVNRLAHRHAYEDIVGTIPKGLVIHHKCRNTLCVNPKHLEPMTQRENVLRSAALRTHCPKGHLYDKANTQLKPTKYEGTNRVCRKCGKDYAQRQRDAKK